MKQAIGFVIFMAVFNALILLVFYFAKANNRVYLEGTDQSMEPEYQNSTTFKLTPFTGSKDVKPMFAVAYFPPDKPAPVRVGWLIAKEGQKVASDGKSWTVDGKELNAPKLGVRYAKPIPEFVVPRGTYFIIPKFGHDDDSTVRGPIPHRCIVGRMPEPKL